MNLKPKELIQIIAIVGSLITSITVAYFQFGKANTSDVEKKADISVLIALVKQVNEVAFPAIQKMVDQERSDRREDNAKLRERISFLEGKLGVLTLPGLTKKEKIAIKEVVSVKELPETITKALEQSPTKPKQERLPTIQMELK